MNKSCETFFHHETIFVDYNGSKVGRNMKGWDIANSC